MRRSARAREVDDDEYESTLRSEIVVPGDALAASASGAGEGAGGGASWLRGHGTFVDAGTLTSNLAGRVTRVNRLVSVVPLAARYVGEVGDVVVGRVREVGSKRWRVDVRARQDGVLMLSAVNLQGGAQRRRTFEDQLAMRQLLTEEDLVSAEVHAIFADGSLSLHARSLKYGKLENGLFVAVAPGLVRRLKQHFVTLPPPCGVDLVLGLNGYVWITESLGALGADGLARLSVGPDGQLLDAVADSGGAAGGGGGGGGGADEVLQEGMAEAIERLKALAAARVIGPEARARMARVRNALALLSRLRCPISPESILAVYEASERGGLAPAAVLLPEHEAALAAAVPRGL